MKSIWEDTREGAYEYFSGVKDCYDSLIDDLSRKVFLARMAFDLGEWDGYVELVRCSGLMPEEEIRANFAWVDEFARTQKPVYVYGAGQFGGHTCRMLQRKNIHVAGFFDRNYTNIGTRCGLPVLAPPTGDFKEDYHVFVSLSLPVDEIAASLRDKGVPEELVLNRTMFRLDADHQYFDFPEFYRGDGVFVDAGCFDCDTSIRFSAWSQGSYQKILALEPDPVNLKRARDNAALHQVPRIEFLQAGLWNVTQDGCFGALGNDSSRIVESGGESIQLLALDDVMAKDRLAFLKMDIEGAEWKALEGAEHTLKRDQSLCAISAYHKPGDQIALMKYLKQLVPEYRFALRHYTTLAVETVLYAFIDHPASG